jgi:ABC-type multidrug transport system fused ATPase/permease subunit
MNTKLLFLISILALVLGACASSQRSAFAPAESGFADEAIYAESPAAESRGFDVESNVDSNTFDASDHIVIKNASLEIVVNAPDESLQSISRMAEEMGGFVVSANLYQTHTSDGQEVPRASITIRVPSDRLDEALTIIEAESDRLPLNKNIQSQDVTSDYTDLQSRLTNLEAAESQLMQIMESANRTEDVLNVFDQLTRVREQIEVLKGQMQYLENSAKLSAVSVELIPNEVIQPISIGGWEPVGVINDAIQSLIVALQGLVYIGIWLALFILPIVLIIGVPLFLIIRGVRNRRRRSKEKKAEAESGAPPPEEEPEKE